MGVVTSCKFITVAYHMESDQSLCQFSQKKIDINSDFLIWPQGYEKKFMLNSAEHESVPTHKC